MRSYPLKQADVDQEHKYNESSDHPCADLTPAQFVTLLVTGRCQICLYNFHFFFLIKT